MGTEILNDPLTGVSRETLDRLEAYAACLTRWQARINLVGRGTLGSLWDRHIRDSAQLLPLFPDHAEALVDLGSGAGLPGLVLAILGVPSCHLVESDQRKAAFLREAARAAGVSDQVTVHVARVEALDPRPAADVVMARALAPLDRLLGLAEPWLAAGAVGLFPKGRDAEAEIAAAAAHWRMDLERRPSAVDPQSTILRVTEVARV